MSDLARNSSVNSFRRGLRGLFSTETSFRAHASGVTRAEKQHAVPIGNVEVVLRPELTGCRRWPKAFSLYHKDHRYHELVEDTIQPKFDHRYFVIKDKSGQPYAVQPFFVVDLDLAAGTNGKAKLIVDRIRRIWPRFMYVRSLMVGSAAGAGQLDGDDESVRQLCAQLLVPAVLRQARAERVGMVVLKEFPAHDRKALECFGRHNFVRVPSLPMTSLDIRYASFEDYMKQALSHAMRKDLRRKFRVAARTPPIEMSVLTDISAIVDEVYPLYLQVYDRSNLHFEKLTPEYLCELGRRMPDKTRFFVWHQGGRFVAMSICMVDGETIHDEYIGLDYSLALDLHLYYLTFRDIVTWAISNGYKEYHSTALSYDPKLHLKCRLEPLDLYVRHTSRAIQVALRIALPWLEPTR
jgi:Acetyltransferase (GNAT) domain